jgi:hypothetical protein|tara:strand:- start:6 stop:359 length:354 start_codon:yes stop_codon:yes gene_type:complete
LVVVAVPQVDHLTLIQIIMVDLAEEETLMAEEVFFNQHKIQAYQILQTLDKLVELVQDQDKVAVVVLALTVVMVLLMWVVLVVLELLMFMHMVQGMRNIMAPVVPVEEMVEVKHLVV